MISIWPRVVNAIGGFHEVWPLTVIIHDKGITICWRRIVRLDVPSRRTPTPTETNSNE